MQPGINQRNLPFASNLSIPWGLKSPPATPITLSISILATSGSVNIYVTGNITVSVLREGVTENHEAWPKYHVDNLASMYILLPIKNMLKPIPLVVFFALRGFKEKENLRPWCISIPPWVMGEWRTSQYWLGLLSFSGGTRQWMEKTSPEWRFITPLWLSQVSRFFVRNCLVSFRLLINNKISYVQCRKISQPLATDTKC